MNVEKREPSYIAIKKCKMVQPLRETVGNFLNVNNLMMQQFHSYISTQEELKYMFTKRHACKYL